MAQGETQLITLLLQGNTRKKFGKIFITYQCCVVSFFPTVLQPLIEAFSNGMYNLLVRSKICNKAIRKYDVSAPTTITISIPGADNQDADRRR